MNSGGNHKVDVSLYIASITRFFRVHKSIMKAIEAYYTYVDRENTGIRIAGIFARYQDENCHDISCEEEVLERVEKLFDTPIVTDIHQVLTDCQRYVCKYDTCFELFVTLSESYDEMERMLKEGNEEERYLLRWYLRTIYYLGLGYRKLDAFRCGLIADQESLVKRDIECFIDDICDFPDEFLPYDNFLSNIQRKYLESSGWKNHIKDMVMWLYSVLNVEPLFLLIPTLCHIIEFVTVTILYPFCFTLIARSTSSHPKKNSVDRYVSGIASDLISSPAPDTQSHSITSCVRSYFGSSIML